MDTQEATLRLLCKSLVSLSSVWDECKCGQAGTQRPACLGPFWIWYTCQ